VWMGWGYIARSRLG